MYRILLVDDHELFRSGMKKILAESADMEVIGEVESGEEAFDFINQSQPDLVLMDIHMPGIGGIEATRKIVRKFPQVRVIVVTATSEDPFPNQLLDAGARGYISKGCPADEMFDALRAVMRGEHYISNKVARKLTLAKFMQRGESSPLSQLTAREMQVMLMITQGSGNQEISDKLFLSPKTVSTYRHRVFEKLEVSNDVELTHFALRYGLLDDQV